MQAERSMYEAASRAVLHQREPDGTRKAPLPTHAPHAVVSSSAGIATPSLTRLLSQSLVVAEYSHQHGAHGTKFNVVYYQRQCNTATKDLL